MRRKDEVRAINRSSTEPVRKPDVIAALDTLINERALENGVGRWDFLHSLNEIDASHWAKILKGSARLTPGKFQLLSKALCENKAQCERLNDLFSNYYSQVRRTPKRQRPHAHPEDLTSSFNGLLGSLDVRREDLSEKAVFQDVIRQTIRLNRSSGKFAEAKRNGKILVNALHKDLFRLNDDKTEEQLVDLMTALCYAAYQTADADLFSFAVNNTHLPGEPTKSTPLIKASRLHLQRRFNEVFLDAPIEQLLSLQAEASSLTEDSRESCEDRMPMGIMIRQNFSRLSLRTGQALDEDRAALERAVDFSDRDGDRFIEFQALCRAYLAKWYLVKGDIDNAQCILADAISLLDRKLGKFHWARASVRECQADCVLQEIQNSAPSEDLAETCLGYLEDALTNIRVCENNVQVKQLQTKSTLVQNLLD